MVNSAPKIASNEGVAHVLAKALSAHVIDTVEAYGEVTLIVRRDSVDATLMTLRDEHDYQQLMEIAGVDYPDRPDRFEVCYHLLSLTKNHRIRVKVSTDEDTPVPTVTHLWPVAGWLEREVYDMYGVLFAGNPDLRRILTDYGFRGHPFRKDFPLTGYVEMRYSEEEKRVVYEPVQLAQDFRTFDFMSPWEGADYVLPGDEKAPAGAPDVDKPKTTDSPAESGAGKDTDEKATKKQSNGSPAQEKSGTQKPAPDRTKGGNAKKGAGAADPQTKKAKVSKAAAEKPASADKVAKTAAKKPGAKKPGTKAASARKPAAKKAAPKTRTTTKPDKDNS